MATLGLTGPHGHQECGSAFGLTGQPCACGDTYPCGSFSLCLQRMPVRRAGKLSDKFKECPREQKPGLAHCGLHGIAHAPSRAHCPGISISGPSSPNREGRWTFSWNVLLSCTVSLDFWVLCHQGSIPSVCTPSLKQKSSCGGLCPGLGHTRLTLSRKSV